MVLYFEALLVLCQVLVVYFSDSPSSLMQEVLKQLQSKLEQEAGTLASSGRSDVLHQLKGVVFMGS